MVGWQRVVLVAASAVALTATACGAGESSGRTATDGSTAPAAAAAGVAPVDGQLVEWCDDVPVPGPIADGGGAMTNPDPTLMGVLDRYASAHPDTYAGLWIDRAHGGTVVLAFTDDAAPHRLEIAALTAQPGDDTGIEAAATTAVDGSVGIPPSTAPPSTTVAESGAVVDVVQVERSNADLDAVRADAEGLFDDERVDVESVGLAPMRNRVSIGLAGAVDDDDRRALATLVPADSVCVSGGPPVQPSYELPATMIPAEGSDPWVTCTGASMPFRASALGQPPVLAADDPLRVAFEHQVSLGGMGAIEEWSLLVRDDDSAVYAFGNPPTSFTQMRREQDRWVPGASSSGGPCEPRALLPEGVAEADWSLDPDFAAPQPGDTTLHLLVTRRACSGGEPVGDDLVGPEVVERGGQVLVAVGVTPMPPGSYTCIGSLPEPIEVTLEQPLGPGALADGTYVPPRPVAAGASGLDGP